MTQQFIIRDVVITDFDQWEPLWKSYNQFYGRNELPDEITQTTWKRFFDKNEPMYALVAEKQKQLVGIVHYLFHRSTLRINGNCYLQDLYTQEIARGQGIGKALIEAVYVRAKAADIERVYWQTKADNNVARQLYDKVGKLSEFVIYEKYL